MSRRKTWDVEDDMRLRRSVLASDAHVDDNYYTRWVGAGSMIVLGTATHGNISNIAPTIVCAQSVDSGGIGSIYWPQHWRRGRLVSKSIWRHGNATPAAAVVIETFSNANSIDEPTVAGQIIANYQETIVLASGGATNQVIESERMSQSIRERFTSSTEREVIFFRAERTGTLGADTATVDINLLGVLLTWKPEPSSV